MALELQSLGVGLIDAPVSGGPSGALAGTMVSLCGGDPDTFSQVRPLLELTGPAVIHFGASGNGHVAKLKEHPGRLQPPDHV